MSKPNKLTKAKKQKRKLKVFLQDEFPPKLFLCRSCGRTAMVSWRQYATGGMIRCRDCDGIMGTVRVPKSAGP